jgi:hypothetical protein
MLESNRMVITNSSGELYWKIGPQELHIPYSYSGDIPTFSSLRRIYDHVTHYTENLSYAYCTSSRNT